MPQRAKFGSFCLSAYSCLSRHGRTWLAASSCTEGEFPSQRSLVDDSHHWIGSLSLMQLHISFIHVQYAATSGLTLTPRRGRPRSVNDRSPTCTSGEKLRLGLVPARYLNPRPGCRVDHKFQARGAAPLPAGWARPRQKYFIVNRLTAHSKD